MGLGNNLYELRNKAGLSQDALAEKLDVSRQSVSKWETDASVPELDKLIKLSELFNVTLDELILDRKPAEPVKAATPEPANTAPEPTPAAPERYWNGRRVAGTVLLTVGGVGLIVLTVVGGLMGAILALPILACGGLCFACEKRPGLWCAWTVVVSATLILRFATGASIDYFLSIPRYVNGGASQLNWSLIMSAVILGVFVLMTAWTLWDFRKVRLRRYWGNILITAALWALCLAVIPICRRCVSDLLVRELLAGNDVYHYGGVIDLLSLARSLLFVPALVMTVGLVRKKKS